MFKLRNKRADKHENSNVINVTTTSETMYQIAKDLGEIKGSLLARVDNHEERIKKLEKIVETK